MDEKEFLGKANPIMIMIFVNQLHRKKLEHLLEGTGLHRAQHRMLMTLAEREFDSQVKLAAVLEVSTATVAVSLKKLERDGYIKKISKKEDSRANFVRLTEKGKKIVTKSREIFEYVDRGIIQGFSEEELISMRKFLKRMYDNLVKL